MMEALGKQFAKIGARIKIKAGRLTGPYRLNIMRDKRGEYFELLYRHDAPSLTVLQVVPKERHLLLYGAGDRFLCGHDERHLFVAGIADPVSTVREAKRALVPHELNPAVHGKPQRLTDKRRNEIYVRQGEWFFVPAKLDIPKSWRAQIHKNEPLQRSAGSKPHMVQELYRQGGEKVYLVAGAGIGGRSRTMSELEYQNIAPDQRPRVFREAVMNAEVYARGWVRHADHATVILVGWHRVFLNAEPRLNGVAFLD